MTRDRYVGNRAVIALLGLLTGLLLLSVVHPRGASAQDLDARAAGKNGPERVFALNAEDKLLRFDGGNPQEVRDFVAVQGLGNDNLVGIDFRPANGLLYGLGRAGNVYQIRPNNGRATQISTLRTVGGQRVALHGQSFGIDFNPTVDRLRVVSNADQNLRVNVDTGETTVDGDMRYANNNSDPRTTGVAYTNSREAAFGGSTEIYYIETNLDRLTEADDPNSGIMMGVGRLGVSVDDLAGFDIVTRGGRDAAYAALKPQRASGAAFYNVSRSEGQARRIGTIGGGNANVEGIAIPIGQR